MGKGQGLVIVEAMKMENEVRSPIAATVKGVGAGTGSVGSVPGSVPVGA